MRRSAGVLLAVLLVLASCFTSGCSSLPFSGAPPEMPKKIDEGFSGNGTPGAFQRYGFEDAVADLLSADLRAAGNETPANVSQEKHIKSIRGEDLDEKGDAGSWTFVIEQAGRISLVTYDQRGVATTSVPGTIRRADIDAGQIRSPRELFEQNRGLILNTTRSAGAGSLDLSLSDGYYSLAFSGNGTPRILIFDAKTGALNS